MGHSGRFGHKFLVVEDSPVFAALATSTIRLGFPDARVEQCHTYDEALDQLKAGMVDVLVCGYGLDSGKTAHDIRALFDVPMVVLTGRPDAIRAPRHARVVEKMAGPIALQAAIEGVMAG